MPGSIPGGPTKLNASTKVGAFFILECNVLILVDASGPGEPTTKKRVSGFHVLKPFFAKFSRKIKENGCGYMIVV